jgi:hypothetical protein
MIDTAFIHVYIYIMVYIFIYIAKNITEYNALVTL